MIYQHGGGDTQQQTECEFSLNQCQQPSDAKSKTINWSLKICSVARAHCNMHQPALTQYLHFFFCFIFIIIIWMHFFFSLSRRRSFFVLLFCSAQATICIIVHEHILLWCWWIFWIFSNCYVLSSYCILHRAMCNTVDSVESSRVDSKSETSHTSFICLMRWRD